MTLSPNKSEVLYICLTFDFESTQGKDKKRETVRNEEKETEMKEGTQRQNKEK